MRITDKEIGTVKAFLGIVLNNCYDKEALKSAKALRKLIQTVEDRADNLRDVLRDFLQYLLDTGCLRNGEQLNFDDLIGEFLE